MNVLLEMQKASRDEYKKDMENNLKEFYDACDEDDKPKMLAIAKKGSGIKLMLYHLNKLIKEAETNEY